MYVPYTYLHFVFHIIPFSRACYLHQHSVLRYYYTLHYDMLNLKTSTLTYIQYNTFVGTTSTYYMHIAYFESSDDLFTLCRAKFVQNTSHIF